MLDLDDFERKGYAVVAPFLHEQHIADLIEAVTRSALPVCGRGGTRDIAGLSTDVAALADHPTVRGLVEKVLSPDAFPVRATLFDKTDGANWKVPWHQDVTVAVASRVDVPGYGPWSVKAGVTHVQPPAPVLQKMLTVRIHLDACPRANGALRVMSGSHRLGKLNQNFVEPHVNEAEATWCEVEAGGALVMHPLLLHASSPAANPQHRRVVHFDYSCGELHGGLEWHMRGIR